MPLDGQLLHDLEVEADSYRVEFRGTCEKSVVEATASAESVAKSIEGDSGDEGDVYAGEILMGFTRGNPDAHAVLFQRIQWISESNQFHGSGLPGSPGQEDCGTSQPETLDQGADVRFTFHGCETKHAFGTVEQRKGSESLSNGPRCFRQPGRITSGYLLEQRLPQGGLVLVG